MIGPVNHTPCGIISFPPPSFDKASIATANASVHNVFPSPIAPKSRIFKVRDGISEADISGI